MRILLVEDDQSIVAVVTAVLDQQNYVVDVATDGEAGWELIESFPYDLVLLDIVLPKLDGITLCRKLRSQKKQVLVMLLTAQDTTTDKLLGLDAGADDYLVKPFDVQELTARIRALLRRGNRVTTPVLTCGNLQLNPSARQVTYSEQLLRFSRKEYLLLELFLRHQHRVFSRSAIVDQIWSFSEEPPNEDTVKSHIKSIRRKLDAVGAGNFIETLYGQGYRINPAYLAEIQLAAATAQKQQTLDLSISEIWQRTQAMSRKRVNILDQAVQELKSAGLSQDLQQKAIQAAHQLSGSLGTFGFDHGSQAAHQLENLLRSACGQLSPAAQKQTIAQIEPLVALLQNLLDAEPAPDLSQPAAAVIPSPEPAPLLLICDQDHEFAEAMTAEATAQHLRTLVASTPETAHELCRSERPQVALIELALLGAEAADWLTDLQRQPAVPIVVLSADDRAKNRVAAVQAGGQLFLKKPISPATVLQAINDLMYPTERPRFRLLVVDDDPLIAQALIAGLEPQGIEVIGLEDSTLFWEVLDANQPLDLLILDVNMPEISGIELCRTIRCDLQQRWLPIIFLTAQLDHQTQQQIFAAGADDLILKPFEPADLAMRLLNRLRHSNHYSHHHSHRQSISIEGYGS